MNSLYGIADDENPLFNAIEEKEEKSLVDTAIENSNKIAEREEEKKVQSIHNAPALVEDSNGEDTQSVYQTLYNWGKENDIFNIDVEELRKLDPNFNLDTEDGFKLLMYNQSAVLAEEILREKYSFLDDKKFESFVNAMANGATLSDFAQAYKDRDWDSFDIRSSSNQKLAIQEDLRTQGRSKDYIDRFLKNSEANNSLRDDAQESLNSLITRQENDRNKWMQEVELENRRLAYENERYKNNVEVFLRSTDNLAGIPINNTIKSGLQDFMFNEYRLYYEDGRPYLDEAGNPQYSTGLNWAMQNLTVEQQILIDTLVAQFIQSGFSLKNLETEVKNSTVKTLENHLKKSSLQRLSSNGGNYGNSNNPLMD